MSDISPAARPAVLFVCVKNGGKPQMAAGLMKLEAGDQVTVTSAGTHPGKAINALSAEVLQDLGIDITAEQPKALTEDNMRAAGCVVVLGTEATVPTVDGVEIEIWETDEPSLRGIEGTDAWNWSATRSTHASRTSRTASSPRTKRTHNIRIDDSCTHRFPCLERLPPEHWNHRDHP